MKTEIIVFGVSHYDMTDEGTGQINRGANIKVLGDDMHTNNAYGVSVTEAEMDYNELTKVIGQKLPAKFNAKIEMITKKLRNSKEGMVVRFTNLEYLAPVKFVDVK